MPLVLPLPRSETRGRFMERLGLIPGDARHRQIYDMMKSEAIEGRRRIIAALSQRQDGSKAEGTITTSQIPAAVFDEEIRRIYADAQGTTRVMYNLAADPTHPEEPNWIIRWMLWHVVRYRDRRQHNGADQAEEAAADLDDENNTSAPTLSPNTAAGVRKWIASLELPSTTTVEQTPSARRYDPIRDQWRG